MWQYYRLLLICFCFFYLICLFICSLHLLSVLLVIHRIDSININEPLIDTHATAINIVAHDQFQAATLPLPLPSAIIATPSKEYKENRNTPIVYSELIDKSRPSRNQTIDYPRNVINQGNFTAKVQTQFADRPLNAASTTRQINPTKSIASSGKVYNKNDLRKRKIKSTGFDQLIDDWKCPNLSENSRYLECGCDIPYTLRCSGDIHGLQQIAQGLRTSKYPVSLLDCTLKNVTFLSDARIFDNVSLHGLVISSGEIKRVHRQAFFGIKGPLQAIGLPNNALPSVPSQSLAPLTSLDRLDLSNNRIKYLDSSDFLVS